jgi:hypothetical protein
VAGHPALSDALVRPLRAVLLLLGMNPCFFFLLFFGC